MANVGSATINVGTTAAIGGVDLSTFTQVTVLNAVGGSENLIFNNDASVVNIPDYHELVVPGQVTSTSGSDGTIIYDNAKINFQSGDGNPGEMLSNVGILAQGGTTQQSNLGRSVWPYRNRNLNGPMDFRDHIFIGPSAEDIRAAVIAANGAVDNAGALATNLWDSWVLHLRGGDWSRPFNRVSETVVEGVSLAGGTMIQGVTPQVPYENDWINFSFPDYNRPPRNSRTLSPNNVRITNSDLGGAAALWNVVKDCVCPFGNGIRNGNTGRTLAIGPDEMFTAFTDFRGDLQPRPAAYFGGGITVNASGDHSRGHAWAPQPFDPRTGNPVTNEVYYSFDLDSTRAQHVIFPGDLTLASKQSPLPAGITTDVLVPHEEDGFWVITQHILSAAITRAENATVVANLDTDTNPVVITPYVLSGVNDATILTSHQVGDGTLFGFEERDRFAITPDVLVGDQVILAAGNEQVNATQAYTTLKDLWRQAGSGLQTLFMDVSRIPAGEARFTRSIQFSSTQNTAITSGAVRIRCGSNSFFQGDNNGAEHVQWTTTNDLSIDFGCTLQSGTYIVDGNVTISGAIGEGVVIRTTGPASTVTVTATAEVHTGSTIDTFSLNNSGSIDMGAIVIATNVINNATISGTVTTSTLTGTGNIAGILNVSGDATLTNNSGRINGLGTVTITGLNSNLVNAPTVIVNNNDGTVESTNVTLSGTSTGSIRERGIFDGSITTITVTGSLADGSSTIMDFINSTSIQISEGANLTGQIQNFPSVYTGNVGTGSTIVVEMDRTINFTGANLPNSTVFTTTQTTPVTITLIGVGLDSLQALAAVAGTNVVIFIPTSEYTWTASFTAPVASGGAYAYLATRDGLTVFLGDPEATSPNILPGGSMTHTITSTDTGISVGLDLIAIVTVVGGATQEWSTYVDDALTFPAGVAGDMLTYTPTLSEIGADQINRVVLQPTQVPVVSPAIESSASVNEGIRTLFGGRNHLVPGETQTMVYNAKATPGYFQFIVRRNIGINTTILGGDYDVLRGGPNGTSFYNRGFVRLGSGALDTSSVVLKRVIEITDLNPLTGDIPESMVDDSLIGIDTTDTTLDVLSVSLNNSVNAPIANVSRGAAIAIADADIPTVEQMAQTQTFKAPYRNGVRVVADLNA